MDSNFPISSGIRRKPKDTANPACIFERLRSDISVFLANVPDFYLLRHFWRIITTKQKTHRKQCSSINDISADFYKSQKSAEISLTISERLSICTIIAPKTPRSSTSSSKATVSSIRSRLKGRPIEWLLLCV